MSNKTQAAKGAFGKPKTDRKGLVKNLNQLAQQMYHTMQQQNECIQEYYGSLCQITEMLEANDVAGDVVPKWMAQKARTLIDSAQPVQN